MRNHHPGPLIRKIRMARGISINELAKRAGMPNRHCNISRYERELKNSLRAPECLYPIAEALGTSVPALLVMQEMCSDDPWLLDDLPELLDRLDRVQSEIGRIKRAA